MLSQRLTYATADLDPPLAALDVAALRRNAMDLVRRASGKPVRLATKSIRCRWVLEQVLALRGFSGLMCYSVAEANWLCSQHRYDDILLGYPSADRAALRELIADERLVASITLMIDHPSQLDFIARLGKPVAPVRVCLDVDASLRIGRAHLGVRRSPLRSAGQAADLADDIAGRADFVLRGLMFYEAQIAGLPDSSPAVALMKRRSADELATRRTEVVAAVRRTGAELDFVNSGGTGSLEISSADPAVSEVTAGSGLYAPTLFDGYRQFEPSPAMFFALPVVRRPSEDIATLYGGGYVASGPAKKSRLPRPVEDGLELLGTEGAGEVQTPVRGSAAGEATIAGAKVGDRFWFRHAKAGELLERFDTVNLVEGSSRIGQVPSYRGEGRNFG